MNPPQAEDSVRFFDFSISKYVTPFLLLGSGYFEVANPSFFVLEHTRRTNFNNNLHLGVAKNLTLRNVIVCNFSQLGAKIA